MTRTSFVGGHTSVPSVNTAIVVGGGNAGPAAALALRKAGIGSTVYEAYPSSADGLGGKLMVAVRETPDKITALFEDGTSASGDVLIGADGIHSTVRKLIDPHAPAPQSDGLLGLAGESDLELPGRTSDTMYFAFGKRAF